MSETFFKYGEEIIMLATFVALLLLATPSMVDEVRGLREVSHEEVVLEENSSDFEASEAEQESNPDILRIGCIAVLLGLAVATAPHSKH